ncbi:hypothetical protein HW932_14935 [Allochromatium humboldtianum]|uniref:Uncharacterized protein n=1 Tax=Allochromatium humboldtianum TaxID=504901 RepID=A0A850RB63_9GAMM|nr:hypothetical protein [Allochromatium humboldtianum]NVZ10558.1 hypothetical protein [Allochromatium humboldtianum]
MAVLDASDVRRILLRMAESGAPIHRARAALEVGDPLERRPMTRRDGKPGWELADRHGVVVARMAAKFQPPDGEIMAVRVAAVLVRTTKGDKGWRCGRWELVEVGYVPV